MKPPILLLILSLGFLSAKAQYRARYNELLVGAEVAAPATSYMSKTYYGGIGGTVSLLLPIATKDALSISASGYSFVTQDKSISDDVLVGMVGYRYTFQLSDDIFYIEPSLGNTFMSLKRNNFTYSGGIGRTFGNLWDISLRYQSTFSFKKDTQKIAFVGLNLSYDFSL